MALLSRKSYLYPPAVDENKQRVRNNRLVMEYGNIVKKVASEYKFLIIDLASKMQENKNFPKFSTEKE